jgi:hypothetical protein
MKEALKLSKQFWIQLCEVEWVVSTYMEEEPSYTYAW